MLGAPGTSIIAGLCFEGVRRGWLVDVFGMDRDGPRTSVCSRRGKGYVRKGRCVRLLREVLAVECDNACQT